MFFQLTSCSIHITNPEMSYIYLLLSLLIFCSPGSLRPQKEGKKITIQGTVMDQNSKPVEGAVVFIDKVKTTSVTDREGKYSVKVKPKAEEILIFTLLYGSVEENIAGRTKIDFILGERSPGIPMKQAQANQPASNKVLDGRDPEFNSYQSIYDMIRGRFPGVEVNGKSIKITGSSSLNVSTEPLFVVDGVAVKSIDDIVPQTVSTIEVLKGPEASVWGTRGSNGVIVITRRKD